MRAVLYIRVSTTMQAIDGYSVAMQRRTLSDFCDDKGYDVVGVFADEGISGKDVSHRPEMMKLVNAVENNEADIIVIWALSRLTRSVADLYDIWQICCQHNVDIVSLTEPFDTSSPLGRAMMGIMGVFAQMERELTAERVSAAMLERAMQGKRTAHCILGYDLSGTDSYSINPEEAQIVRYIFEKYIEHKSLSAVAEICNLQGFRGKRGQKFSAESIKKIITRSAYVGYNSYKGELYKGDYQYIIPEDVFKKAQKIINSQRKHR